MNVTERLKQSLAVGVAGAAGSLLSDLDHLSESIVHDTPIVFGIVTVLWFAGITVREWLRDR